MSLYTSPVRLIVNLAKHKYERPCLCSLGVCLGCRFKQRKATVKMHHNTKMGVYISEAFECPYLRSPLKGTSTLLPVNLASTARFARQNRQFCIISKDFSRPTTLQYQSERKVERETRNGGGCKRSLLCAAPSKVIPSESLWMCIAEMGGWCDTCSAV